MDGRTQEGDDFVSVEHDHEFLNTDKSNLALQTQYFTDSLKNFNDIAVHSKMMLELIAKRILGQPKVIPTVYLTDGDFSPPVDEVVAIRAMVMSTQTTPVVITVNGIIPMLVSTVPTQIVTGPISSVTVGNTVPGNPVYVQYLDERAALLSNTSTQDDVAVNGTVSLTGSSLPCATASGILVEGPIDIAASASYSAPALDTNGYHYALFVPASAAGAIGIGFNIQYVQGVKISIHNGGSELPPGMTGQNYAIGFNPPINDQVSPGWVNTSSTASATLGNILYVLSE